MQITIKRDILWLVSMLLILNSAHIFAKDSQVSDDQHNIRPVTQLASPVIDSESESLYLLGVKYLDGNGVNKNASKAFRLFKKAAKLGFPRAEYQLGVLYRDGYGVARDKKEALKWFKLAAAWGDTDAKKALSKLVKELS